MVLGDRACSRWIEALAFAGLWIATGEVLDMSTNAYLLFGIPLTAGFQLFVRKRPIKDPTMRLRLLAPILVVVFPAGCGGERKSLRFRPRRPKQTRIRRRLRKRRPGTKGNKLRTEPA